MSNGKKMSTGLKVGITVGTGLLLIAGGFVAYKQYEKRQQAKSSGNSHGNIASKKVNVSVPGGISSAANIPKH